MGVQVDKAVQDKQGAILRAQGEAQSALLIGEAIQSNPAFLTLRKIEVGGLLHALLVACKVLNLLSHQLIISDMKCCCSMLASLRFLRPLMPHPSSCEGQRLSDLTPHMQELCNVILGIFSKGYIAIFQPVTLNAFLIQLLDCMRYLAMYAGC